MLRGGTKMAMLYAGLDVSLELISICVVDEEGRMVSEDTVASETEKICGEPLQGG